MNPGLLVVAVLLLVANGFFVAVEFALIASRRTKLAALAAEGSGSARLALQASRELGLQLAGAQLGITMASLGLGAVAEPTFAALVELVVGAGDAVPEGLSHAIGFAIGLTIAVFLHMVVGEMIPKNLAIAHPERVLLRLALANRVYMALFGPIIRVLNAIANLCTRALGVEPRDEVSVTHTGEEIASMLAASREEGLIEETAHDLLTGALDFGEKLAREVMVPTDQLTVVPRNATVAEAERLVVQSGHSRLLVAGDGGGFTGFVHAKDLLTVPPEVRDRPIPLARIRRVLVVRADRPLDEVLVAMRRSRTHLGVVVDGDRAVGLITLEDVLEDLVGDILDESDPGGRPRITSRRRQGN